MTWTLTLLICSSLTAQCYWHDIKPYPNERACVLDALSLGPPFNPQFKCYQEHIPLPRPRPK